VTQSVFAGLLGSGAYHIYLASESSKSYLVDVLLSTMLTSDKDSFHLSQV